MSASAIVRGALVDVVITIVGSVPLVLILAGENAASDDESVAQRAIEQAMASPEGLLWGALLSIPLLLLLRNKAPA